MRRRLKIVSTAAALAVVVATATAAGAAPSEPSTSDVVWFADQSTKAGTSQLLRTPAGVHATLQTSGLMPREAVTLWWVVFNDPRRCTLPCNEDDIFIDGDPSQGLNLDGVAAADIVAGYAAGAVADRQGEALMAARLRTGSRVADVLFGETPVLKTTAQAEIHLVVRSHGPAVPGLLAEQIGTYAGGCEVFLNPPAIPATVGECGDIQFAVHPPPQLP